MDWKKRCNELEERISTLEKIIQNPNTIRHINTRTYNIQILKELEKNGVLSSSDIRIMFDFSQNNSARNLMEKVARAHPKRVNYDSGNRRQPGILTWVGWSSVDEKRQAFLARYVDSLLNTWLTISVDTVKRKYRLETENEFQEFCRGLPKTIQLKKWRNGWRFQKT